MYHVKFSRNQLLYLKPLTHECVEMSNAIFFCEQAHLKFYTRLCEKKEK